MFVHVYACLHMYMYTYECVQKYICTYIYNIYIYVIIYTCLHIYISTSTYNIYIIQHIYTMYHNVYISLHWYESDINLTLGGAGSASASLLGRPPTFRPIRCTWSCGSWPMKARNFSLVVTLMMFTSIKQNKIVVKMGVSMGIPRSHEIWRSWSIMN